VWGTSLKEMHWDSMDPLMIHRALGDSNFGGTYGRFPAG
jgi:hypothetical protein